MPFEASDYPAIAAQAAGFFHRLFSFWAFAFTEGLSFQTQLLYQAHSPE
jgi:hypothetical protein